MHPVANLKRSTDLSDTNFNYCHTVAQKIISDDKSYLKRTTLSRSENGPASRESEKYT
jgi:hypothetical protein